MPRKPRRAPPPDPADQLRIGRPSAALIDQIWQSSFQDPKTLEPYWPDSEMIGLIRHIASVAAEFIDEYRRRPDPIFVIGDDRDRPALSALPKCKKFLELFLDDPQSKLSAITRHFPQHQFHPLFRIYEIAARENRADDGRSYFELAASYVFSYPRRPRYVFSSHAEMLDCRDRLNAHCKEIYEHAIKSRDVIKSFQRTAQGTRYSLMQYAEHLISRAPKPYIAHFAVYRPSYFPRPVMSHNEICDLRKRFVSMIKTQIPRDNYLGYSIRLRHNARIGFWLDAFVFLRDDDMLRWASASVDHVRHYWQTRVSDDHAVCVSYEWPASEAYEKTLEEATMATEFDFYCRVIPPTGHHGFWNSQSPIGKLAKRTTIRKKSAAKAAKNCDPLLEVLQENSAPETAALRLNQWERQVEKHKWAKSPKRTAAAKKRGTA